MYQIVLQPYGSISYLTHSLNQELLKGRDANLIPTILGSVPDMEKESSVCLFEDCRNDRINGVLSQKSGVSIFHKDSC